MKQKDNESLLEYSKRLKQAKYILKAHAFEEILVHYIENKRSLRTQQDQRRRRELNMKNLMNGWRTY